MELRPPAASGIATGAQLRIPSGPGVGPTARDSYEPATGSRFMLDLGDTTIQRFVSCEGISGEYEVEEWREGGQMGFVHRLPGRVRYANVRMTRPVDKDTPKLGQWFAQTRTGLVRRSVRITACNGNGEAVATWALSGAWPVRYSGPVLSAKGGSDVALETVELAHNGFEVSAG